MSSLPQNAIALSILGFPQNLLIAGQPGRLSLRVQNYFNKQEDFRFIFEGENIQVEIPAEFNAEKLTLGPLETKDFDVNVVASADGIGKLILNIYWYKSVEFPVKVQKVRECVPQSKIKEIFDKQTIQASPNVDAFNPKEYIVEIDSAKLIILEQQLLLKKTKLKRLNEMQSLPEPLATTDAPESTEEREVHEIVIQNIDYELKQLAKAYLAKKELKKALDYALELSNEEERMELYANLIRAANSLDLDGALEAINKIKKKPKKNELIKQLALDRVDIDAEQSGRIAFLIDDPSIKELLMTDIIAKTYEKDPEIALKLSYLLDEPRLKVNALFNIAKGLNQLNKKDELADIINQIVNILISSNQFNLLENDCKNPDYTTFSDAMACLAEVDCPTKADVIIEGLQDQKLKEKIALELFNTLYEMVDEIRTKIEPTLSYSTYFMFNTFASKVTRELQSFSMIGGNLSNNLLLHNYDFKLLIVSLFSFNFSIFPIIDRAYIDLKVNQNKSFAYFIFPSVDKFDDDESKNLNAVLQLFTSGIQNAPGQVFIFNLDFIPYLGMPTIIISSESELYDFFYKRIQSLGNGVNLLMDDSFFQAGKSADMIKARFTPPQKFKVINVILSYEFINNFDIFKAFIELFTK